MDSDVVSGEPSIEPVIESLKNENTDELPPQKENIDELSSNEKKTDETKSKKKKKTPGVIYLSRIPKKMNVKIIREYFSRFGDVDRIFLEPKEKKRKNEPRSFSEGWVEFKRKKIAKQVAKDLNNMQVGGKRRNPWYFELWNLKYLKNFRWTHLNERMAYEQEMRKQRLRQEIALAKKETNFYIQSVEKNEKKKRFDKKSQKLENADQTGSTEQDSSTTNKIGSDSVNEKPNKNLDEKSKKDNDNDDDDDTYKHKKHPKFERKVKVTGNDTFLKQIFS